MACRHKRIATVFKLQVLEAAALAAVLLLLGFCPLARAAQSEPSSLTVLNYITGWELDSAGYHPCVYMLLENSSGRDLTGMHIRFQGRFTDLQTASVTLGRREIRRDLKAHQQFPLSVKGGDAFELPGDVQMWPRIEAKIMCRVADVGDEGTETLLISAVDEVAHSEDDAFQALNTATSYAPNRHGVGVPPKLSHPRPKDAPPSTPLTASAQHLPAPTTSAALSSPKPTNASDQASASAQVQFWLSDKRLPGLGDDFYQFERRFGLPQQIDAKHSAWTWAKYKEKQSGCEVIAGAQERRGEVSVILVKVPHSASLDASQLANQARNLAGKLHAQTLSSPSRSVRYLSAGRVELLCRNAPGYRIICLASPDDNDNCLILMLARAPIDAEQLLVTQARKVDLLSCVRFLDGADSGRQ